MESYSTSLNMDRFSTAIAPLDGLPKSRTQTPVTTGTSVLGLKFNGGIMICSDMLGSYGSMARYRTCERMLKVNENTLIGCSGDFADFQYIRDIIQQMAIDDDCKDDGFSMNPKLLHSWLTRVLYNKRSKFDPLWTNFIVGGIQGDGTEFLGFVDMIGTAYKDNIIATGFGAHIATPMMRAACEKKPDGLTQDEARKVLIDSLRVLYYRDARAFKKYQVGIVTADGCKIEGPFEIDVDFSVAHLIKGH